MPCACVCVCQDAFKSPTRYQTADFSVRQSPTEQQGKKALHQSSYERVLSINIQLEKPSNRSVTIAMLIINLFTITALQGRRGLYSELDNADPHTAFATFLQYEEVTWNERVFFLLKLQLWVCESEHMRISFIHWAFPLHAQCHSHKTYYKESQKKKKSY